MTTPKASICHTGTPGLAVAPSVAPDHRTDRNLCHRGPATRPPRWIVTTEWGRPAVVYDRYLRAGLLVGQDQDATVVGFNGAAAPAGRLPLGIGRPEPSALRRMRPSRGAG